MLAMLATLHILPKQVFFKKKECYDHLFTFFVSSFFLAFRYLNKKKESLNSQGFFLSPLRRLPILKGRLCPFRNKKKRLRIRTTTTVKYRKRHLTSFVEELKQRAVIAFLGGSSSRSSSAGLLLSKMLMATMAKAERTNVAVGAFNRVLFSFGGHQPIK